MTSLLKKANNPFPGASKLIILSSLILGCAFLLTTCRILPSDTNADVLVTMYVIDVGQGLSVLFKDNHNNELLYDAGPASSVDNVESLLSSLGVDTIEDFVLSHPHNDHYGGMFSLFRTFPVKRFHWSNFWPYSENSKMISMFLRDTMGVPQYPLSAEDTLYCFNKCRIKCLWPENSPLLTGSDSVNLGSVVIKLTVGKTSLILPGDIGAPAESLLVLKYGPELEGQLLLSSHHGSRYANTIDWLSTVNPETVILSCGKNNSYGHPSQETLNRYEAVGCNIRRNDVDGTIVYKTNGWAWY